MNYRKANASMTYGVTSENNFVLIFAVSMTILWRICAKHTNKLVT